MNYCSVNEAFNNSPNQIYDKESDHNGTRAALIKEVEDNRAHYGVDVCDNNEVNYSQIYPGILQNPNFYPQYFNAQGNIKKNNVSGTPITQIDELNMREGGRADSNISGDNLSLLDSDCMNMTDGSMTDNKDYDIYSDSDSQSDNTCNLAKCSPSYGNKKNRDSRSTNNDNNVKAKPQKLSHQYCISRFIYDIMDDNSSMASMLTTGSTQNSDVYDHIKGCKYCRTQINQKLKQRYITEQKQNAFHESIASAASAKVPLHDIQQIHTMNYPKQVTTSESVPSPTKVTQVKSIANKILGYDIKEIVIIIFIGVFIIFVLDLFVKVGRKLNK